MRPTLYIRCATVHILDVLRELGKTGTPLGGDYLDDGEYILHYRDPEGREHAIRFNKEFEITAEEQTAGIEKA